MQLIIHKIISSSLSIALVFIFTAPSDDDAVSFVKCRIPIDYNSVRMVTTVYGWQKRLLAQSFKLFHFPPENFINFVFHFTRATTFIRRDETREIAHHIRSMRKRLTATSIPNVSDLISKMSYAMNTAPCSIEVSFSPSLCLSLDSREISKKDAHLAFISKLSNENCRSI